MGDRLPEHKRYGRRTRQAACCRHPSAFVLQLLSGKESISEMDGGRISTSPTTRVTGNAKQSLNKALSDPLCQSLSVVRDPIWSTMGGVMANLMLNDIVRIYGVAE